MSSKETARKTSKADKNANLLLPCAFYESAQRAETVPYREYQRLRHVLKLTAAGTFLLCLLIVPCLILADIYVYNARPLIRQLTYDLNEANKALSMCQSQNKSTTIINPRALPPRRCISGFTMEEIQDGFDFLQGKYDKKARVWEAPCSLVQAVDYSDKGLKGELDYVVV